MRNISTGIDIGSLKTRVVIGEFLKDKKIPKILGVGEVPTLGMRHGYVSSLKDVMESIKSAADQAEKISGLKIKKAYVSIGGVTLRGVSSVGTAIISKADSEVTNLDIEKALNNCEANLKLKNKRIIHSFPLSYKLDGEETFGSPEGMHGNKLEAKSLLITCSNKHIEEILAAISEAGIKPLDLVATSVAESLVALSNKQKIVGCALVDIGAETTTLAVFENNTLMALRAFSIGSTDITNDIALGLKIDLEEAERLKLGSQNPEHSKKKLEEIIEARFSDIFEVIDKHLKKIKRSELLPAGAIFVGGGANTASIEELARQALNLPAKVGSTNIFGNVKTKLRNPEWFAVLGLILYGHSDVYTEEEGFGSILKDITKGIKSSVRQFLP